MAAASSSSSRLLKLALPLIAGHGFTRETLARTVTMLPAPEAQAQPLSDSAVTALFGAGDSARKLLFEAWLEEGLQGMRAVRPGTTVREALKARLAYNEPVLPMLPEVFAFLASPRFGVPLLSPTPAVRHAVRIADEACYIAGDSSIQMAWYARRLSLAGIYIAAELHQIASPKTADAFLESLLESSASVKKTVDEMALFSMYAAKSGKGIFKSLGMI